MKEKRIKVFFISNAMGDFISRDIRLLERHFQVRKEYYTGLKQLPGILPRILRGVIWADVTFSNFADNHALFTVILSKLFKRKSIVLVGGYEVAKISEFKYGLNRSPFFPSIVRTIFLSADHIIAVSPHLKEEAILNLKVKESNISVVPNGFDSQIFRPHGQKEPIVTSAAVCSSMNTARLKGIDTLLKAAQQLPDIHFLVIGILKKVQKKFEAQTPPNVKLIAPIPQDKLVFYYQRSKIYCQLSLREGHPNALCEAMLCECIPVVSDAPGNTSVVGKSGFCVPYGNHEKTAMAIRTALDSDLGPKTRERIINLYPLNKREDSFCKIINDLT